MPPLRIRGYPSRQRARRIQRVFYRGHLFSYVPGWYVADPLPYHDPGNLVLSLHKIMSPLSKL
jgi:hypothetical protein